MCCNIKTIFDEKVNLSRPFISILYLLINIIIYLSIKRSNNALKFQIISNKYYEMRCKLIYRLPTRLSRISLWLSCRLFEILLYLFVSFFDVFSPVLLSSIQTMIIKNKHHKRNIVVFYKDIWLLFLYSLILV